MKQLFFLLILMQLGRISAQTELVINGTDKAIMDVENKVSIVNCNYTFKQVLLIARDSNHCLVSKRESQWYLYPVYQHLPYKCEIDVVYKKKMKSTFQVECVPQISPIVTFNHLNIRKGMKKSELLDADSLKIATELSIEVLKNYYVSRYRMIYMPMNGNMEEYSINGNQLGNAYQNIVGKCKVGDLLLIDGIRMKSRKSSNYEKALSSLIIKIIPEDNAFNSGIKMTGYVREDGSLKPFIYPKGTGNEFPRMDKRDSLWYTYVYDQNLQDYVIEFSELYDSGKLIEKTFFQKGIKGYTLRPINDSMVHCKIYYPNGNLKHEGNLITNTGYSTHRKFYIQPVHSDTLKPYNTVLFDSPDEYFPIGFWISLFPEKQMKVTTVWAPTLDESYFNQEHEEDEFYSPMYYLKLLRYTTSDLNNRNIKTFEMRN